MAQTKTFFIAGIILSFLLGASSMYTIREGQNGLLLRLGRIVPDRTTGKPSVKIPGLHFKIPIVHVARIFDTRLQTMDIKSSRIVTKEKKDVLVDYYVKWRIKELPRFFTSTGGNKSRAETLLEQKLNNGLRAEFGKRTISDVVSGERRDIMKTLQEQADESARGLGIEVIDVRIKRIDLPEEVSTAVYARMRAERERIANEHRAQGRSRAEAIRAQADAKVTVILAEAKSKGRAVRGEGDGKAAKIYADTYNLDPEFYAFYRSLGAYENSFNSKKDILVLRPNTKFFKYFSAPGKS